ncbi:MAG: DUF302 domain-containing protein [Alphaproteobacteria bacterium]|nr:DUF302 domain-containing protein [Alphaproteobacteria bacterium]
MRALSFLIGLLALTGTVFADGLKTYTVKGAFDGVAFDVESAIVDKGLVIDTKGDVGRMLQRTGKDVSDSAKEIYAGATYFTFCSAVHSRKMMEADADAMGLCPYVVFVYETVAKPGEVVVGYRKLEDDGSDKAEDVLEEIDKWLDGIVRSAIGK